MIKTVLKIDGMVCSMCESHINSAIRSAFDIKMVNSSHSKGITEILSETEMDISKLTSVVNATGYKILEVSEEEYEKKRFRLFGKK